MRRPFRSALLALFLCAAVAYSDAAPPVPVALFVDKGVGGTGPDKLQETLSKDGFTVERVNADDVRADKLKKYRVVIVPGGSGGGIGKNLGEEGRAKMKQFVADGGVYVGVCAGCYLASSHYSWSLGVLPVSVVDTKNWMRGKGNLKVEFTPEGKEWFNRAEGKDATVIYHNGPVIKVIPEAKDKLIPLAVYREEVTKKGAEEGLMVNTPAVAAARHGKGWAIGVSPHPEQTEGTKDLVPAAIKWALKNGN